MRQKAYYLIDEIVDNLFTTGSEWMTETGTEYIGMYHQYTTGETYTEPQWNPDLSAKLVAYEKIDSAAYIYKKLNTVQTKFENFVPYQVKINLADIQIGYITRYFIKKINESRIYEIDSATFKRWQQKRIDSNMYNAVELFWTIAGDEQDAKQENIKQTQQAKNTLPGIELVLNDPLQYYTDSIYIKPADINGLDF